MIELDWKNPNLKTDEVPDKNKAAKISVPNGAVVSNAASIKFTGRGAANYGEVQQENLMRLVENFADDVEPLHPTVGQTWYDAAFKTLMVCIAAGDATAGDPAKWKAVGGILITGVDEPGPIAVRSGQLWYQQTGPLTGILHVSTMSGRYPSNGKTLGGWEQIYPMVETIAGRDEYDYVLELVNNLIDLNSEGSGANLSILKVIDNFEILDGALHVKYNAKADKNLLKIGEDVKHLKISPNSQDWDQILAGARYAINRLEVPVLLPDEISRQPFVQDGRIVNPTLSALLPTNIRYPAIERLANRRAGIVSLIRFYASTINALKIAVYNRYSLKGINNSQFGPNTRVRHHITFSGSQAGHGKVSVMKMKFNFLNKNYLDRFLFSAGAIQLVIRHNYNGTSNSDSIFKELFLTRGAFRATVDDTRTLGGDPLEVSANPSKIGISSRTPGGEILVSESLTGSAVTLKAYMVSDKQFAIEATLNAVDDLVGATTFKFSVIEDIEVFTDDTGSVRVYTAPDQYADGDEDGTSPWFNPGEVDPDPEFPPSGVLLRTECDCADKIGIYTNGKGGTYAELIQANSPECVAEIPCEGELKAAGSILIPGEATGITLIGRGAPGSTVHGGTEYFYTGANGNNSVIFKGSAIKYAVVAQGGGEAYNAPPGEKITATVSLTYRTSADVDNITIPVTVTGFAGSHGSLTLTGNADIASSNGTTDVVITVAKVIAFTKTGPGASSIRAGADTTTMLDTTSIKVFNGSSTLTVPVEETITKRFDAKAGGRVLSFSVPPLGKLRYTFCEFLPPKCPPRGELLKSDCVGTNMVGTYTDGNCSTYTAVITANSPECIVCEPRGQLISSNCVGTNMVGTYTDGNCGTYTAVITANSPTCGPCQGTVASAGTSTIQVPAGVTAVDFVGSGGVGTTIPGGPTGFKYQQKGQIYVVQIGKYIANLTFGTLSTNTLNMDNSGYISGPSTEVNWTALSGGLHTPGPATRNVTFRAEDITPGAQTITLYGYKSPFVSGPTPSGDVADVSFRLAVDFNLVGTTTGPSTTTPGQNTTATIQTNTATFPGSQTSSAAGMTSKTIAIANNTSGVTLTVNKAPGGTLTYNWCSHKT